MFTWLLFYAVSLTLAPSPPTDPVEPQYVCHSSCCSSGYMFFPERALFYFRSSLFHSCDGERHTCCPDSRREELLSFFICIPRRFCPIQVSWGSEGCNPS